MKYVRLMVGQVIASFSIAMVIACNMGVFPITACNMAISNIFGISFGLANMLVEVFMIVYSVYRGEKIGIATIINAIVGGFLIDGFLLFIPQSRFMVLGILLLPVGWAIIGKQGLGEPASNSLMRALMKQTGKGVGFIRTIEEITFMLIGLIGGAPVTIFTVVLSVGFGSVLSAIYKAMKYEPTKIVHKTLTFKRR